MEDKKLIVIRDRRKFNQFSIHNVVIDHWVPIIGPTGFLLYAFYTRLSNKKDEKAFPGYTLIQKHLKIGRGSISEHNRLLSWCGLIHIEEGGRRRVNEYYILAVPDVTADRIEGLRELIAADGRRREGDRLAAADKLEEEAAAFEDGGSSQVEQLERAKRLRKKSVDPFWVTVLKRLDGWRPVTDYWKPSEDKITVVREGQMGLFNGSADEQGDADVEQGSSGVEQGSSAVEQSGSVVEQTGSAVERSGSAVDPTVRRENPNNPKEQSITTAKNNNPNQTSSSSTANGRFAKSASSVAEHQNDDDDVKRVILDWMGFDGNLNHVDKNPSMLNLLAWGLWVYLRGENSKNPIGVARSKWRRGEFPESDITDYAKENTQAVLDVDYGGGDVVNALNVLVADFGRPLAIPNEYAHLISR